MNISISSPKEKRLSWDEFQALYAAHKAEWGNKDPWQVVAGDSDPHSGAIVNYFQKMSAIMDQVREKNLDTVIADALAKYDKVLVVYGSAHQYKSRPVLEAMFKSPPHHGKNWRSKR